MYTKYVDMNYMIDLQEMYKPILDWSTIYAKSGSLEIQFKGLFKNVTSQQSTVHG